MIEALVRILYKRRRLVSLAVHGALIALSSYMAFWLRFDGVTPFEQRDLWWNLLPLLILTRATLFLPLRLHEGLWRYTGFWDLRNIVLGVVISSGVFYTLVHVVAGQTRYPRSVFIIDAILLVCLMTAIRLSHRTFRAMTRAEGAKRVIVYGAGDAGEIIVRDMRSNAGYDSEPVGFVDDDPAKQGLHIHGVPVLGSRADLPAIMRRCKPDEVLIAIPTATPAALREILHALEPFETRITTLPSLRELVDGRVTIDKIRRLQVEDLLARAPVGLDPAPLGKLIAGKVVMVTGAGGSVGSELCRQVMRFRPAAIVLFERYENSLYAIENELNAIPQRAPIHPVVGDITDRVRVNGVMARYRPNLVFHAAAHKHVPLMEHNPCEALKNNVLGTHIVADAADRYGAERFVLISSDKAVNPTSVMGTTKRVAELVVHDIAARSRTRMTVVRFGNVLGSNGSVIPRFLDQIRSGGPVTVTHPEVRRFFMSISEAVQLVLHAAALDDRGGTYVLEMGEQIKLVDMARHLIRLSGYQPDEQIPIAFIGLRPGEKLSEELIAGDESAEPSGVQKILRVRSLNGRSITSFLPNHIAAVQHTVDNNVTEEVIALLERLVPTFKSAELTPSVVSAPAK